MWTSFDSYLLCTSKKLKLHVSLNYAVIPENEVDRSAVFNFKALKLTGSL